MHFGCIWNTLEAHLVCTSDALDMHLLVYFVSDHFAYVFDALRNAFQMRRIFGSLIWRELCIRMVDTVLQHVDRVMHIIGNFGSSLSSKFCSLRRCNMVSFYETIGTLFSCQVLSSISNWSSVSCKFYFLFLFLEFTVYTIIFVFSHFIRLFYYFT